MTKEDLTQFAEQFRHELRSELGELKQQADAILAFVRPYFERIDQRFDEIEARFDKQDARRF